MEIHNIVYRCLLMLFLWLNSEACMEEERAALLEIKSFINYPEGTSFSNWYGEDCCLWEGLKCDVSTTRVIRIFLRNKRDRSSPDWYLNTTLFSQFRDLQELELPGNGIKGFTAPKELRNLKSLRRLDLRDNVIEDGSNFCWGKLPSLSLLDVSHNKLAGNFPECLCDNLSIRELNLHKNDLAGDINPCFSNLTLLEDIDLSDNLLEGIISFSVFSNLSSLKFLDLSYNRLKVETEGPDLSPSFKLNVLKLSGCNITNIPSFLSAQHDLRILDLSDNSLPSVPTWPCNATEELWIRGNNIGGKIAGLLHNNSSRLSVLDISNNYFYGPLPEDIDLALPMLQHLDASENSLSGTLPPSLSGMKQLRTLKLSSNTFTGEIPDKMTTNMSMLEFLDLSENNLQGEALSRNTSLPNLRHLLLDGNHFTGTFPSSLSETKNLLVVSIQDNALSGKLSSYLPFLPQLRILSLGGNRLEGQIPRQVCQMRHLRLLDLSVNRLSGDIPRCLGNVSSWIGEGYDDGFDWTYSTEISVRFRGRLYVYGGRILPFINGIDVSCNQLTGAIPAEISQMKSIYVLNMSHNILTGQIPASLGALQKMESLDLSHNKLSGQLPQELTNLLFLSSFSVAFNNLSGSMPARMRQFATFEEDSYRGNPGLCGEPLSRTCSEDFNNASSFSPNVEGVNNASSFSPNVDDMAMYAQAQLLFCWCLLLILCPPNLYV